jgi:hypothetical protein
MATNTQISPENLLADTKNLRIDQSKTIYTAAELLAMKIESIPFLIEGLFQKVGLAALVGTSDVGKSTILRQLALSVLGLSVDFLGFKVNALHKAAIYVSTEDDETAIAYLLGRQMEHRLSKEASLDNLRFLFDSSDVIDQLDGMLSDTPADLVVIDCFTDMYSENMNEANKVRTYLNQFHELARKHKCLVLFLHHTGKGKENEPPSKNNAVGSHAFEAKMRLVVELRKDPVNPLKKHFCIVKGNYLPEASKRESIVLSQGEDFWFSPTGETVEFEKLVKPIKGSDFQNKNATAIEMYQDGKKQVDIARELGVAEGTVSKWIKPLK